jgi:intracellular sulfur oxidation DsrE/DsrF family protein
MTDRREFLGTIALGGVALAVGACATTAAQAPAVRNIFWQSREGSGLRKVACPETMRAKLIQGLLRDVTVVPAMVVALGLAQERGCAIVYAGG